MVDVTKPMSVGGSPVTFVGYMPTGDIVVATPKGFAWVFTPSGKPSATTYPYQDLKNDPVVKTYCVDVYPSTGNSFKRADHRTKPIVSQHLGVFSVNITEIDGEIVKQEIVA